MDCASLLCIVVMVVGALLIFLPLVTASWSLANPDQSRNIDADLTGMIVSIEAVDDMLDGFFGGGGDGWFD